MAAKESVDKLDVAALQSAAAGVAAQSRPRDLSAEEMAMTATGMEREAAPVLAP